jgi:hypothetical protein
MTRTGFLGVANNHDKMVIGDPQKVIENAGLHIETHPAQ